ncbi:hypothetical protein SCP_0408770 [Sparassis crispa]|uniref:SRR1-like domain-containing protein n=1 Tax=Sparassis crispa TaxID=139825 RepID=A0A401GK08_9APHY|nr:hypothetical protein SCP_0408770 [Sparassis crispa]GBE82493.1 hypothetical protein SCP_0408770 [Sparassis crispa]
MFDGWKVFSHLQQVAQILLSTGTTPKDAIPTEFRQIYLLRLATFVRRRSVSMGEELAPFGYADLFTPARSRKKRKGREQSASASPALLLERTSEELAGSGWVDESTRPLTTPDPELLREALALVSFPGSPHVLCLGLGSPAASRDARAQLAFLLAACDGLSIDRAKVTAYDPVFTAEDTQLLDTLADSEPAQRARYAIAAPTVIFMPHCDLQLYENLLRENWTRDRLPNVVLIANRLTEYADSTPSRKFAVEYPCVSRLAPYLTTRALPACPSHPTAFNNTAIQHTRSAELPVGSLTDDWWELSQRPDCTVTAT